MRIVAIDPGGTTGIAVFDGERHRASQAQGFLAAVHEFEREVAWLGHGDLLVCERYTIGAGSVAKSRGGQNTAIELIGVARFLTAKAGIPFELQTPADAKMFSSDDKLKKIGWWTPGKDHARDASRHLLLAAVKAGAVRPSDLL